MAKIITLSEVFRSGNWIITKISQGNGGVLRVDAKRRYRIADKEHFFSRYGSAKYINSLSHEYYGKAVDKLNSYSL